MAEYATVKLAQILTHHEIFGFRGFAFVEMGLEAEKDTAIKYLDGAEWINRSLRVNKAKPRQTQKQSASYPRSYSGIDSRHQL